MTGEKNQSKGEEGAKEVKKKFILFDHEIVPDHRILNEEETINLLSKYNITKASLPKISKKDPCAKLLKAKPGDVIEITRKSPTAGEAKYYRVVVVD